MLMNAPKYLRPSTRKWFRGVVATFELEEHDIKLLLLAAQAWDRSEQARGQIAKHGLTFDDAGGFPRVRPEIAVERDARTAFCRVLRKIDLDVAPPAET